MNNKEQKTAIKSFARELRKDGTKGEAILWKRVLRAKKMHGYQFNRQFVIGNFIVDFICRKLKLIVEVDGSSHFLREKEDKIRQTYLEQSGYKVIRFSEKEIINNIDEVHRQIYHVVKALEEYLKTNPPNPLFEKGGQRSANG